MPFEGMNFGLANPTVKLEMPQESMAKAMQFQQLQQQTEAGKLDLQQKRQAQDDVARIRQIGTETGGDAEKFIEALTRNGFHQQAQAVRKDYDDKKLKAVEIASKVADVDEKHLKAVRAGSDALGALAKTATKPEEWDAGLIRIAQDHQRTLGAPVANPDGSFSLPASLQKYAGYSPATVKAASDGAITFQMAMDIDKENRKRAEFTGATGGVVGGKPVLVAHNAEGLAKVLTVDGKPVGHIPPASQGSGMGGFGSSGGGKIDDAYLASLDPVNRDMIIKIGLGNYGSLDALKRTKGGQAKIEAFVRAGGDVSQVNNAVKWQEDARKTTPGSVGGTYLSVDKSLEHTQRALDVADQFPKEDPGTPYWIQRGSNSAWALTNPGKAKPLEHNWQITTSALLDETEKNILGGKPSVDQARTLEKLKTMPFTATRAEKDAAIQAVMDLTMGQYDAVENQRRQIQGKFAKADSMLSPKSQEIWANFNRRIGRQGETPGAATAPRTSLDAGSPTSSGRPQEAPAAQQTGAVDPKNGDISASGKYVWSDGKWRPRG